MLTPFSLPARARAQLTAVDVSVARGGTQVLHHLDLTVTPASRLAIVGENGRGKSTLLHLLSGALAPDSGSVHLTGTVGIAEQAMPADDHRTVGDAVSTAIAPSLEALAALEAASLALATGDGDADDAYAVALARAESLRAWDAERRVQIALASLDAVTNPARRLADLSVGQRYRVRLACLLGANDDFLLLDEPTNHLDRSGLDFLTDQLRNRNGGVVVVTHDRALLSDVADTVLDLDPSRDGRARSYGNGYEGYREGRVAEAVTWELEYRRQQTEFARLRDDLTAAQNRLVSGWRPEKGTNKHGRATRAGGSVQSVHRRREALEAHAVSVPEPPTPFRFPTLPASRDRVLMEAESIRVPDRLPRPVDFSLTRTGRLLVTGPNGAGKSTLLDMVAGSATPFSGAIRRSQRLRIGYLRQESTLPTDMRAHDLFARRVGALADDDRAAPTAELDGLGLLRPHDVGKRVGELSMGQQRRLDLAIVLASSPELLVLDEPTNHLSIALVDELTEALHATAAAVVVSSHDRQLLRDLEGWPTLDLATGAVRTRVP